MQTRDVIFSGYFFTEKIRIFVPLAICDQHIYCYPQSDVKFENKNLKKRLEIRFEV